MIQSSIQQPDKAELNERLFEVYTQTKEYEILFNHLTSKGITPQEAAGAIRSAYLIGWPLKPDNNAYYQTLRKNHVPIT